MDEELRIPKNTPMSTVLATLSAAAMRLGQPTYVDISGRLRDIVLGIPIAHYEKWRESLDCEPYREEEVTSPEFREVQFTTKLISPEHWTFTIRSTL